MCLSNKPLVLVTSNGDTMMDFWEAKIIIHCYNNFGTLNEVVLIVKISGGNK